MEAIHVELSDKGRKIVVLEKLGEHLFSKLDVLYNCWKSRDMSAMCQDNDQ